MLILCQRFFFGRDAQTSSTDLYTGTIQVSAWELAPRLQGLCGGRSRSTWPGSQFGRYQLGASTELGWGWISWILRCQEAIFGDCFLDVSMAIMIEHVWSLGKKHLEQIWRLKALGAQLTFLFWNLSCKVGNKIKQSSISCFNVAPLSRICDGGPNLKCL